MSKLPYVRSMLVDGNNQRFMKAINTLGLADYIALIQGKNNNNNFIYDFGPLVRMFHERLDEQLQWQQSQELKVQREAIFHHWLRFRAASNQEVRMQLGSLLVAESHKGMSKVSSALGVVKSQYNAARATPKNAWDLSSEKDVFFKDFTAHVETLLEMLLCNIHVTAVDDVESFQNDVLLGEQVSALVKVIIECLVSETDWWSGEFLRQSIIWQCVMESMEIDIDALLELMDIDTSRALLYQLVWGGASVRTVDAERIWSCEWPVAESGKLRRTKVLAELLQKARALEVFLLRLKEGGYSVDGSEAANKEFEDSIAELAGSYSNKLL